MSCLFRSLAPAVGLSPGALRKRIVDYIRTDPPLLDNIKATDIVKWTEGKDLHSYTNQMYSQSTWGGAIEIRAYCELFRVAVCVHVLYTRKTFMVEPSTTTILKTVHINYNGSHFEPMYTVIN